ncbi:MAG: ribonuclease HI family protein [Myxococcota bacterium]
MSTRPSRDDVVLAIEELESLSSTLARFPGLRRGDLIDILRGGRRKTSERPRASTPEPPPEREHLTRRERARDTTSEESPPPRARRAVSPQAKKKRDIEPGLRLIMNSDGASRGNPGPASIGVVLTKADGSIVDTIARYIGRTTNNIAEYEAMRAGLERAKELGALAVHVRADSELAIRQLGGLYRVKNEQLKPLFDEVKRLADTFPQGVSFEHVRRELNQKADALANEALDRPQR